MGGFDVCVRVLIVTERSNDYAIMMCDNQFTRRVSRLCSVPARHLTEAMFCSGHRTSSHTTLTSRFLVLSICLQTNHLAGPSTDNSRQKLALQ